MMKANKRMIPTLTILVLILTIYAPYTMAQSHGTWSKTGPISPVDGSTLVSGIAPVPRLAEISDDKTGMGYFTNSVSRYTVSQTAIQEALSYYPLKIGDEWQYHYLNYETTAGDSGYVNVNVIGDTLMSNHRRYQIMKYHYFKQIDSQGTLKSDTVKYYYERVDSSTANIYRKSYSGEVLRDSLMIQKGDSIGSWQEITTCYDTTSWSVFGSIRQVKLMRWWNGISQSRSYSLVKGIGITRNFYNAEDTNGDLDTLIYAKINGKEYGHFVDTPIQKTPLPDLPYSIKLYQNYPNPFNPTTTIRYQLEKGSHVRLTIYDVLGRRVATLVNSNQQKGVHQVTFNASQLASGVYFYRLQAGSKVFVKKMLLMK